MASSYVNDLRLNEMATGDASGTWGTTTNTNLELIGEALSYGTEGITTNANTHTTTVADGAADPGRAMYLEYTGTLDSACTITISPNTISRMHFIENGTSGSQNIIIKQGSGATITIPPGDTKAVYLDGAGSGAAVVDAFASLNVVDLKVQDDLTVTDDVIIGGDIDLEGSIDVNGTANLDVVDIDGAVDMASTLTVAGVLTGASLDISGNVDVDGTTNLDVVDIDGAVDMASTLTVAGVLTGASLDISGNVDVDGTLEADAITVNGTALSSVIAGTTLTQAAQTNITSLGTLTTLTVDDITINGSTISDGGDLLIDAEGDITLDANGEDIRFKDNGTQSFVFTQGAGSTMSVPRGSLTVDCAGEINLDADGANIVFLDGGTHMGTLKMANSNLTLDSQVADKDIIFSGNDGGSAVTALTFDMSDAGVAKFNRGIRFNNDTAAANELDDYEEGTFTPSNQGGTTGGFGSPSGTYIKIGKQITCDFRFETTGGVSGGLNYRVLRGFPYAMYSNDYIGLLGAVSAYNLDQYMGGYIIQSSTSESIDFFVGWNQNSSGGTRIRCSVTYRTV